jgi:hypothetical protein
MAAGEDIVGMMNPVALRDPLLEEGVGTRMSSQSSHSIGAA